MTNTQWLVTGPRNDKEDNTVKYEHESQAAAAAVVGAGAANPTDP